MRRGPSTFWATPTLLKASLLLEELLQRAGNFPEMRGISPICGDYDYCDLESFVRVVSFEDLRAVGLKVAAARLFNASLEPGGEVFTSCDGRCKRPWATRSRCR